MHGFIGSIIPPALRAEAGASFTSMGTRTDLRAYGGRARRALRAVRAEAERLESLFSRFLPGSDIGRLNASAGAAWVDVAPETFEVLSLAAGVYAKSGGAFDVTVGPLADLWDVLHADSPPDPERIRALLPLVDGGGLLLDTRGSRARLRSPGQRADLGGVGKGWAADRYIRILREHGCASAIVNIGGNVAVLGGRPGGGPWRVGVRHPRVPGALLGAVEARDCAVVTSGDYERRFTDSQGRVYHHILDPATGYPADSGCTSVTVTAKSAALADALSTAVFVLGMKKGVRLLESFGGTEAVLAGLDLPVFLTRGLTGRFTAAQGIRCAAPDWGG